jgi:hypothetical protein
MFQLTKVWTDQEPGIGMVEIRYLWTPLGEAARWEGQEDAEVLAVVPDTNPRVRQAVIEIPRYLNEKDSYQLHYRFVVVRNGREEFSPVFSEEIVAREVPYVDQQGRITEVRVLWGVDGWAAPNWTQARLEGLKLHMIPTRPGHDIEGEGIADDAFYELIQTVRELSGGRIEWTEGMLYPVLHWMEREHLIESEWRNAQYGGRRRRYYRIPKEGRKALQSDQQQWMAVHTTLMTLWKTKPHLI